MDSSFSPPCSDSRRLIVISFFFFLAMWWERMLDASHLCQLVSFVLIASLSLFKLVCVCACACLYDWMFFFFFFGALSLVKGRRWEQPQLVLISQHSNNNKAT